MPRYGFIPGTANQMVGSRDVSCFVEPLYFELVQKVFFFDLCMFTLDVTPMATTRRLPPRTQRVSLA